ncbi:flagellar basal body-associated FliL family protein [Marivita sp. S0852]|uniref:flagellar basal body-associated FliL family protein n=1 Tax=Marivita sp. S0852 TaxID=3373893 RepID=UPI003982B94A
MLKIFVPILGLVLGLSGGIAIAVFLQSEDSDAPKEIAVGTEPVTVGDEVDQKDTEIVKLPNQFVVPVIVRNRVRAMVILTVAVEVSAAKADDVRMAEPKLRDTFLGELFELAAMDGFKDELIAKTTLELVRTALTVRAREILADQHVTVLITDMVRQDTN